MVSVDDGGPDEVATVVAALRKAGMVVDSVEESAGIVLGSVDPDRLEGLKAVRGVDGVEIQRHYSVPPPESDVQ